MGTSKSPLSFGDCQGALERALESERGIQITFAYPGEAVRFQARCNMFRVRDRRQNKESYPEDHPLHNHSIYDGLSIRHSKGTLTVQIEKISAENLKIEEL